MAKKTTAAKAKKAKPKYRVGAIVAIPLPAGKFAYAKVFNDFDLGVYDVVSKGMMPVDEVVKHKIAFFKGVTDRPIKSDEWPIIGEEPFATEDAAWAPPMAMGATPGLEVDPARLQIWNKGVIRRATLEDVAGMDIRTFSQRPELFIKVVVDRLIKGEHDYYRIKR